MSKLRVHIPGGNSLIRTVLAALVLAGTGLHQAAAQRPGAPPGSPTIPTAPGEIRGRLVDSLSGKGINTGSVAVRRAGDSAFVGGALPGDDGSFRVQALRYGRYTLRVRVIGFAPLVRDDIVVSAEHPVVDVGTVSLKVVAAKLEATQTVAEREDVVLQPDRTSYSVKNMTAASGGTAIDILRNIPLVEVDASNNVSLRGDANVVIQINGRTTPLKGDQLAAFLAQLPAGTVKTVEVATNPSAKDDPEGTAGIINIVLNEEASLGLSGGFNIGTSSTGMVNGSGNIGTQHGKLTLFASANAYTDRRTTSGTESRIYLLQQAPAFTETAMSGTQTPVSGGGTLRSEYRFTDRNSLSFDSYFYKFRFGGNTTSAYTDLDPQRDIIDNFSQFESQQSNDATLDLDLTFRRMTTKQRPLFSTELEYVNSHGVSGFDLSGTTVQGDSTTPSAIPTERDRTRSGYPYVNWKADYTEQFSPNAKLEMGLKDTHRATTNNFDAAYLSSSTNDYVSDPLRLSGYDYHEDIGAGYALLSNQIGKLQTQAGVRLEDAATYLDLTADDQQYDHRYASVYPSAVVSWNFTPLRLARLSYSRRVSRPNPYELSPIVQYIDTRDVFHGNPGLRAEYTDAVEGTYQETRSWGTIQLNPYLRSTAHAVRNIQFIDTSGVNVSTFDNVASTLQIGTDLNVNAHHGPLQLGGGASVYHYKSDASNLAGNLSVNTTIWSARTNATWTFDKKTDAQLFAFYRAPSKTEGGSQLATVSMQLAARYKVWGDKGNISLRISDPFDLQKFGYRTSNGTIVDLSQRFFQSRVVFLTISRSFGQAVKLQPKQQDPDAMPAVPAGPGGT